MQINRLAVTNFMAIGDAEIDLARQGLVLVTGENNEDTSADSNGSGKSSLPDAFSWCIYGETARGISGDEVVSTVSPGGTRVITEMVDGTEAYRITRYRKFPKMKNALTVERMDVGTWVDLTKGTTAMTQRFIEQIMGCSKEVFIAAVYAGQDSMPDLPSMTDKSLKMIVEEAAGTDVLTEAAVVARDVLREAERAMADAQIEFDKITSQVERQRAVADDAHTRMNAWDASIKGRIKDAETELASLKVKHEELKAEYVPSDLVDLRQKQEEIEAKITAVNGERDTERKLQSALDTAARTAQVGEIALTNRAAVVRKAKTKLDAVDSNVGKPCDECGKPYEAKDLAQVKLLAADALKVAAEDYAKLKPSVEAAKVAHTEAEDALTKHRATLTDVSREQALLKTISVEVQSIISKRDAIDRWSIAVETAEKNLTKIKGETNPYDDLVRKTVEELANLELEVEAIEKRVKERRVDVEYEQEIYNVYAPNGVRAHILDIVTPYLNDRTAHYLGSLADGAIDAFWTTLSLSKDGKDLKERFSIAVEKPNRTSSFAGLSGGEKRKVRLACALALQDLVASRASKPIDLFVGDEIDDALDASGLERLMSVLEEKARERGTVLVISHNDIKHYARRTLAVVKDASGVASVELVL